MKASRTKACAARMMATHKAFTGATMATHRGRLSVGEMQPHFCILVREMQPQVRMLTMRHAAIGAHVKKGIWRHKPACSKRKIVDSLR